MADAVVCNAGTILLDALVGDRPAVASSTTKARPPGESWAAKNVIGKHYEELAASSAFYRAESLRRGGRRDRAGRSRIRTSSLRNAGGLSSRWSASSTAAQPGVSSTRSPTGSGVTRRESRDDPARPGRGGRRRCAGRLPPARGRRPRDRDGQRARRDGTTEILERYERDGPSAADTRGRPTTCARTSGSRGWRVSRRRSTAPTG